MTTFVFTDPSGKEHEVTGPAGSTKEQAFQILQAQLGTVSPKAPAAPPMKVDPSEGMPWYEKALVGAGSAVDRAKRALTPALPDVDASGRLVESQAQRDAAQGKADAELYQQNHPGGWATAGEIGADIAMSAIPVARGAQGLTAASRALRAGKTAPLVGDVAANVLYAGATAPENRGEAAMYGGAGAVGGRVLNRTLGGLVRPTAASQELLDQGVRMTPGQAGEGVMGQLAKVYEDALGAVPIAGRGVKSAQKQGLEDWNRAMLQNAVPGGQNVADFGRIPIRPDAPIGQPGVDALKGKYTAAYDELFPKGNVLQMSPEGAGILEQEIAELRKGIPASLQDKFDEFATGIAERLKSGVPAPLWKETITGDISAMGKAAYRNGDNSMVRALKALNDKLLKHMEAGRIAGAPDPHELVGVDAGYKTFKVLQQAGQRAAALKRGGALYPSEVAVGAAQKGDDPLYRQALDAQEMFGTAPNAMTKVGNLAKAAAVGAVGHSVAGGLSSVPALISLVGSTPVGRRFLMGQIPWQAVVQAHPEIASQVGRALATEGAQ